MLHPVSQSPVLQASARFCTYANTPMELQPMAHSPVLRAGVRLSAYANTPIELHPSGGWHCCALAASLPLLSGCLHMSVKQSPVNSENLKRLTYETLRQADCRMNDFDDFCDRGYLAEYREYETLRRNFLLEQSASR